MARGKESLVKPGTAVSNMPGSLQHFVSGYQTTEKKQAAL